MRPYVLYVGEVLEDETDDHYCAAKMGGEPRPTGRANLFDTKCNEKRGRASVPKYTNKKRKGNMHFINLVTRNKITISHRMRSVACWRGQHDMAIAVFWFTRPRKAPA
jgi:hypothetical protein